MVLQESGKRLLNTTFPRDKGFNHLGWVWIQLFTWKFKLDADLWYVATTVEFVDSEGRFAYEI
jgi:hypothetical protein